MVVTKSMSKKKDEKNARLLIREYYQALGIALISANSHIEGEIRDINHLDKKQWLIIISAD